MDTTVSTSHDGIYCRVVEVYMVWPQTQHLGERSKTDRRGIGVMCWSGATCLPTDLFQWASTMIIQLSLLVYHKVHIIIILSNVTCSHNDIADILLI
jgi:hypothetical protein